MVKKRMLAMITAVVLGATVFSGCGGTSTGNQTAGTSTASAAETGSIKDELILGCDTNFAPMAYMDNGNVVGFDIDLAKAVIEDKMGKKLTIQPINWDSKEAELETGKVDIIWNGLTITDERKKKMNMSKPYMENKQVVVVPKDSAIKTPEDLAGKTVGMQKESTAVQAFQDSGIKAKETVELKDNVACLTELASKRIDAIVMDSVVADYYLSKNPTQYPFHTLDKALSNEFYGIAVKKGNDTLLKAIQDAFDQCVADGTAGKIATQWFGSDTIYKES